MDSSLPGHVSGRGKSLTEESKQGPLTSPQEPFAPQASNLSNNSPPTKESAQLLSGITGRMIVAMGLGGVGIFGIPALLAKHALGPSQKNSWVLAELERGLGMILANSASLENPRFSKEDFYHAHFIQKGKSYGFLFHTRELLPAPSLPSKRNIIFWIGASGYYTQPPKSGISVYPNDLGAKEVGTFYFHPDKQTALELARGIGTPVTMTVSDGQNNTATLWVVIPP